MCEDLHLIVAHAAASTRYSIRGNAKTPFAVEYNGSSCIEILGDNFADIPEAKAACQTHYENLLKQHLEEVSQP